MREELFIRKFFDFKVLNIPIRFKVTENLSGGEIDGS